MAINPSYYGTSLVKYPPILEAMMVKIPGFLVGLWSKNGHMLYMRLLMVIKLTIIKLLIH